MKNLTLFSTETRFKDRFYCCLENLKGNYKFLLVVLMFLGSFVQVSAQGTLVPSCNLTGPLEACAVADPSDTSGDFVINIEVARSGAPNLGVNPLTGLSDGTFNTNFLYSFASNSSGAFIRSYGPVTYNPVTNRTQQALVVFPGSGTPEFNLQLNATNTSSVPATVCECSKSVSISKVAVTSSFDPITCYGQTTTLTAVGSFSDQGTYTYTLLPSGPSNTDGIFAGLAGSEAGITYTIVCESAEGCIATTTQTITQPAYTPVVLNCPETFIAPVCLTQSAVNVAFTAWLASFSFTGGTTPVLTRTPAELLPPSACGGSVTVTWTVRDQCGEPQTCTRTFTVPTPPAVVVSGPQSSTTNACSYADQNAANAAFNDWLEDFTATGGCSPVGNYGQPVAPEFCGGSVDVTFNVTDSCYDGSSITRTFTITPAPEVVVTTAQSSTTNACTYENQEAANAAFATWLEGFTVTGGCAPLGSFGEGLPVAPPYCGGTTTVVYTVRDKCYQTTTYTRQFIITPAPAVVVTTAQNSSTNACAYANQAAADAAFATWLEGFTVTGGCAPVGSYGQPVAPPYCGGSVDVTFEVNDRCYDSTSVTRTFEITPAPAVVTNIPESTSASACTYANQAAADAAWDAFLNSFSVSGGCAPVGAFTNEQSAPSYCGGTRTVTYVVVDRCYVSTQHTRTFEITPAPAVVVTQAQNSSTNACAYANQDAANAAFALWLEGFSVSGGCSPVGSFGEGQPTAPEFCGGSRTVTYSVSDKCYDTTRYTATFEITPAPAVVTNIPESTSASACTYANQAAADAAWEAFLNSFSVSGGCAPVGAFTNEQSAPSYCGGSRTVTYVVVDKCYVSTQHTRTFEITPAPAVVVTQAQNSSTNACTYANQDAANAAFALWLEGFSVSGGCDPVGSFGEGQPTAPEFCGGSRTVTYSVSDKCYDTTRYTATFEITPAPAVVTNIPESTSASACTYANQDAANAAWEAFLNSFSVSGGCAPVGAFTNEQSAPSYCGGSRTVTYVVVDKCYVSTQHTRTFEITPAPAVVVGSAQDSTTGACTYSNQDEANAAFALWLRGFTVSGGCAPVGTYGQPVAPPYCGGSVEVTYSVSDKCYDTTTYTATFTITPAPAVVVGTPTNSITPASTYANQAAADAAFAAWLEGFTVTGGCAPSGSYGQPTAPYYCGGSVDVTFEVNDRCYDSTSVVRTFTITPATPVDVDAPDSTSSNACVYANQAEADAAFLLWLSQFSVSGGINPIGSFGEGQPSAPTYCGGETIVTYTVTDRCYEPVVITRTFTITPAPAVEVDGPENSSTNACTYANQEAANEAFALWIAQFSVDGGCAPSGVLSVVGSEGQPTAPEYCGGTITVAYTVSDKCYLGSVITRTFEITPAPAVVVNAPQDNRTNACTYANQDAANAAFLQWLQGFTVTGGCSPIGSFGEGQPTAPEFCGGSRTITYTVSDKCYETTSRTATFTITPAPEVVVNVPADKVAAACAYANQAEADAAWTAFLNSFSVSGGCAPVGAFSNEQTAPSYCGGTRTVTYVVVDKCYVSTQHTRTFTITPAPQVTVNEPGNFTAPACAYANQAEATAAYEAWLAGFTVSGGCNAAGGFASEQTAPDYCGGSRTVTFAVAGRCYDGTTITRTFTITPAPQVTVNEPGNFTAPACTYANQAAATAAYEAWLAQFSVSGGCNATGGFASEQTAPAYCGGSRTVTFAVAGRCYAGTTITRTFTITAAPAVVLNCGNDVTVPACSTQAQVNAAWAAFKASATASGGCANGTLTNNAPAQAPSICGGSVNVTWTYTVNGCGTTQTCTRTFTVAAPAPAVINCAQNVTLPACSTQAELNAAWNAFLNSATATGGCGGVLTRTVCSAPSLCGGYVDVTWKYTLGSCAPQSGCGNNNFITCTRRFTVQAPAQVAMNCAQNVTMPACSTQAQVDAAYAAFLASTTASGGCGGVLTNNGGSAPSACGGYKDVTWTYRVASCGQQSGCGSTNTVTCTKRFTVQAPPQVRFTCGTDVTVAACKTQAQVDAAYAAFLASTTASGGCGGVLTNNAPAQAPSICGGFVDVTWTYTVAQCGQQSGCGNTNTMTCTKRFKVNPVAPVVFTPGNNVNLPACSTQAQVNTAWNAFLASTTASGGCNGIFSRTNATTPSSCGGSVDVTWTYTTTGCGGQPSTQTATRTFTVAAPAQVVLTPGNNVVLPACSTQAQLNTAWNAFLNSTTATGGCGGRLTRTSCSAPSLCGGYVDVTWTYTVSTCGQASGCGNNNTSTQSQSITRRFTVAAPSPLTFNAGNNVVVPACSTQAQVTAAWNTFLNSVTVTGGCNATLTRTSCSAPSICGGYVDVTWTATTASCGQQSGCGNGNTQSITRRFTVSAPTQVSFRCGNNVTLPASSTQAQIATAWNTFLNSTTASGGCNGTFTRTNPSMPTECGEYVDVTWTYTVGSCGQQSGCGSSNQMTCTKRFAIGGGSSSVTINVNNVTLPSCKTQAQVNAAWTSFLASATVSGGSGTLTHNGASRTAPSACGGYTDVTWTYSGGCGQTVVTCGGQTTTVNGNFTVTRRFTVQSGGQVDVAGPSSVSYVNTHFNSQYAVNTAFANWLAQFRTVATGCGATACFSGDNRCAPSWTQGGSVRVTYSIAGNCNSDSVTATFTITRNGNDCKIEVAKLPATPMVVKAYPNPYSENFSLDLTTSSVEKVAVAIYDMTGKLIDQREVSADEVSGLQVGDRFPSGVYNVIVTQGAEVKTLRVIKR